jgi:phosphoribosylglycinamide formyltransferase-1
MDKIKVAVLISGRGSNLKALINACKDKNYPAEISLVISNKQDALGLEIARSNNINSKFIDHKLFDSREGFDRELTRCVKENDCKIICLAGFMRILSSDFTQTWQGRLINVHPSLLPSFKGSSGVQDALDYGVKHSGCTVHRVNEEVDSGEILAQEVVPVMSSDTQDSLSSRILEKEHIIYPIGLKIVCEELTKNN